MSRRERLRVAVLLSGTGRTLENLLACRARGELNIDIVGVVSSRPGVRGLEIAQAAGLPTHVVSSAALRKPVELSAEVRALLGPQGADLLALAGFLRRLDVLPEWRNRIINVHPSLLPLFGGQGMYGGRVHQAVLDAGVRVSGATVHFVNEAYDAGPIMLQHCVPVLETDDAAALGARVFDLECKLYPQAIQLIADGLVRIEGRRVRIQTDANIP